MPLILLEQHRSQESVGVLEKTCVQWCFRIANWRLAAGWAVCRMEEASSSPKSLRPVSKTIVEKIFDGQMPNSTSFIV